MAKLQTKLDMATLPIHADLYLFPLKYGEKLRSRKLGSLVSVEIFRTAALQSLL